MMSGEGLSNTFVRREQRPAGTRSALLAALACLLSSAIAVNAQSPQVYVRTSRSPQTASARSPQSADVAPRTSVEVITVVHRLSGWKLRAWLAQSHLEIESNSPDDFVHTKIVAGCLLGDNRTIIARLPQAEIEALRQPPEARANGEAGAAENRSAIIVVRRDNRLLKAKFIGLDGGTGLSLLEIDDPARATVYVNPAGQTTAPAAHGGAAAGVVAAPARQTAPPARELLLGAGGSVSEGQRVRLFAPAPSGGNVNNDTLRLRMSEVEGRITGMVRARSGQITELQVQAAQLTPQFYGAVATSESGEFIGIVGRSLGGEARLTPTGEVRGAARRVLARRASVPQVWLGARGDAVAMLPLERLVASGLRTEEARRLLVRRQGVMLTAIAPNAPAAAAGLRPGDIVLRVGDRPVRTTEEFTFMLREAGNNSIVGFTVLRGKEPPRRVEVRLSESLNPSGTTETIITRRLRTKPAPKKILSTLGVETILLPPPPAGQSPLLSGMLVLAVKPQSAAAAGGLRAGDVIETINGKSIFDFNASSANSVSSVEQTADLSLTVLRDGRRITLNIQRQDAQR